MFAKIQGLLLGLATAFAAMPLRAQGPFQPISGYNLGLNPSAWIAPATWLGRPAFVMLVRGNESIASFHDPALLGPLARSVVLDVRQWAVLEPNACAIGAGLFFDTQFPIAAFPTATIAATGWNAFSTGTSLAYANDPFHSTWHLGYCSVAACTSPCGPGDRDPDWEVYLLTVR